MFTHTSQKGITTPLILAAVVILLVIVGGVFFINRSGSVENTTDTESTEMMMEESHTDDSVMQNDQFRMEGENGPGADETSTPVPDVTIELSAQNFSFSQQEIRVKQGQVVKIVLTSTEGFHDWVLEDFNVATGQVNTGQTSEVTFMADKTGTFEYYCSVGSHRQFGMVGNLIVE